MNKKINKRDNKYCFKQIKYDNIIIIKLFNRWEEFNFGSDWTLFSSFKTCKSLFLNIIYYMVSLLLLRNKV